VTALRQTWQVYMRGVRTLMRQPAFLFITIIQPIIWLLLFGALFKSVALIPGFKGTYIDYLTPGVVVMIALFGAGWSGMAFVEDIANGVMDRMLSSPVWRGSLNVGWVVYEAAVVMVQTILIVGLAAILGANFAGGVIGVVVMFFIAALLAASVASFSNAVGVLGRQRETVIGIVSFVQLPLVFLSTGMMQKNLLPDWMQTVARYNPVNWAVEGARAAAMQKTDWSIVGTRGALLAGLAIVAGFVASRAFTRYQRSL
jgi:ABC-2 type transport system permease protein